VNANDAELLRNEFEEEEEWRASRYRDNDREKHWTGPKRQRMSFDLVGKKWMRRQK
jgi:hypothetical protein